MPGWDGSTRRSRLPRDWRTITARVLQRDPTCQLAYDCCTGTSTEVDHIDPMTDDHADHRLQGVCGPCHARKSSHEGGTFAAARRASVRRPRPPHPGLT